MGGEVVVGVIRVIHEKRGSWPPPPPRNIWLFLDVSVDAKRDYSLVKLKFLWSDRARSCQSRTQLSQPDVCTRQIVIRLHLGCLGDV